MRTGHLLRHGSTGTLSFALAPEGRDSKVKRESEREREMRRNRIDVCRGSKREKRRERERERENDIIAHSVLYSLI